jgi:hypothetical protein
MAASKLNYLVVYKNHSQVYGCSSKKIAIESPPPEGYAEEDKNILFVTFEPDTDNLCVYKVDKEEEIITTSKRKKKTDD